MADYSAKSGMRTDFEGAIKGLEQGSYTPESRAAQAGLDKNPLSKAEVKKKNRKKSGVKGGDMGDSALVKGYKKSVFKSAAAIHKILMDGEDTDSSHNSGSDY